MWRWSVPCVRAVATKSARPALASQAEKARSSKGAAEKFVEVNSSVHRERARKRDNIMPSRHSKADNRWVRWNASPARPSRKAAEKVKCTGVIRGVRTLTASF